MILRIRRSDSEGIWTEQPLTSDSVQVRSKYGYLCDWKDLEHLISEHKVIPPSRGTFVRGARFSCDV